MYCKISWTKCHDEKKINNVIFITIIILKLLNCLPSGLCSVPNAVATNQRTASNFMLRFLYGGKKKRNDSSFYRLSRDELTSI